MALQRLENRNASPAVSREAGGEAVRSRGAAASSLRAIRRGQLRVSSGAVRACAFLQLSQLPDSTQLLQPFSYTTARFSRRFQLPVPREAAQQPEGPGSRTAAKGAMAGWALPSEPCPPGSGRQEDSAILHPAPLPCPAPAPGTQSARQTCLPGHPAPVLLIWGQMDEKVSQIPSSCVSPQSDRACSSAPQAGKNPHSRHHRCSGKGHPLPAQCRAPAQPAWLSEGMKVIPSPGGERFVQKFGLYPERCQWGCRSPPAPALLGLPPAWRRRAGPRVSEAERVFYHCEVKSTNSAENFSAGSCGDGSSTTCLSCWKGVPQES